MDITNEVGKIIGSPEGPQLEYKAVLPPSRTIARLISSFANTDGGYIILGISDDLEINGLSDDFHANSITHKALDLLSSQPQVHYQYVIYEGKKLYVIKIEKSEKLISFEDRIYDRDDEGTKLVNPTKIHFKSHGYSRIKNISQQLEDYKKKATSAKVKLIEHYQSILKIVDDLGLILYPLDPGKPTSNQEGKVLSRILFSSFIDNFETYLSDLLFEIFLAIPATLKSKQQVTIEEVLSCSDLQDFVEYWAKQKISKLQKGSVKNFIKENKQISDLHVIDQAKEEEIEKILQIRHLYSHRNGIVDEKFLQYYSGQFTVNSEHQMSISEICDRLCYLAEVTNQIDVAAITKYKLA
ncbi:helix-turn-helix domain-containing protein [Synechococcus sp. PCC 7336]|uniref:AlbA family DNA-binding domain-containing protein n=1 Tax=Synechococcus sp. PCC 7336 TaxID=195250 RepID=UPI0003495461|nr:RNA-binding domain-containing protein [Synechococcus sp. PCC 7336]